LKFKYLIIAFSVIIIIIILVIALLPMITSGPEFAANFRYITLPLVIFMVCLLIFMGIFVLINYRLLLLLEREDWPALSYYLEQKIFVKGRYTPRNVRLLASSYLVVSDFPSVLKLEHKALLIKPSVIEKNVLIFGAARVLSGGSADTIAFFKAHMDNGKPEERQWIHWFFGFSQLLNGSFGAAETEFTALAMSSKDALITGLSSYFLQGTIAKYSLKPEECRRIAENGRTRIMEALPHIDNWNKEVHRMSTEIYIAVVRKYINETRDWVYENREEPKSVLHHEEHDAPDTHPIISDRHYKEEEARLEAEEHDKEKEI
jgi:hypothetical protein